MAYCRIKAGNTSNYTSMGGFATGISPTFGASPAWAWVNMFKKEMSKECIHRPMNVLN